MLSLKPLLNQRVRLAFKQGVINYFKERSKIRNRNTFVEVDAGLIKEL
jgi:hypothetical protein